MNIETTKVVINQHEKVEAYLEPTQASTMEPFYENS